MPKAIEVATLLGDSLVELRYCTEAPAPRWPRFVAAAGLVCVLAAGTAFGLGVAAAARNDAAFVAWTTIAKRPAWAFRQERVPRALDALAFGGLALGLCAFAAALVGRRRFDAPETDLAVPPEGRLVTQNGLASTVVSRVELTPEVLTPPPPSARPFVFAAGSIALHAGVLALVWDTPVEDHAAISFSALHAVVVDHDDQACVAVPEEPDYEEVAAFPPMELDDVSDGYYYIRPNGPADPQLARSQAIESARSAGIFGSGYMHGGAFASLLRTQDFTPGFDDITCGPVCTHDGLFGTIGGRRAALAPTTIVGRPVRSGDYDKATIRRSIRRNLTKITYCYERELLANPSLQGPLHVQFVIAPDGSVEAAQAWGVDESVGSCVAKVVEAITFPRPRDGATVQVSYPFSFRPAGP